MAPPVTEVEQRSDSKSTRRSAAAQLPGLDPLRGWALGVALAAIVALALPASVGWAIRAVAAWDAALLALLGLPWLVILRSDAEQTHARAAAEDPGDLGILAITLAASGFALAATVVLMSRPNAYTPRRWEGLLVGLGIVAVAGAWALLHTAFALHYARLYYAPDVPSGLEFADGPPDDLDFAYFAFGIGMTFAVSDVSVSRRELRRVVLLHAVLSFAYNTTILALAINLIIGRL